MNVKIDLSGVLPKVAELKKKAIIAATNQANIDIHAYVPMGETGILANTAVCEPEQGHIEWVTPYAHYVYEGIVYGPNIPIIKGGAVVGFFSPPHKSPTGRRMKISRARSPKAQSKWIPAAKRDNVEKWRRAAEKGMGGR